ncbi:outer membrane lipoprotein-sorting protein [Oceanispirochaeta sp.]|uniref:outer membrane lipoprotein-sorting protein n=1 Tax=Oceanispirochaeta sp. TaxID=2035350 RepID=UPI00260A1852|nr:outer membrane lipoprotein-sorting protein [Oceanispirochaeta sp.]MDA3958991.1 outer membrane lipoprotein-sorting protein [Oceanispirochaeta sp.]
MKNLFRIVMTFALLSATLTVCAQDAQDLINQADKAFELDAIYSRSTLQVIKSGREQALQVMEGFELDDSDGISRSLSIFLAPPRVAGTAYLMLGDDLWVRFASTGRIRKLSSSAKKNSAAGSDFSYADMGEGSNSFTGQYSPSYDGTEKVDGQDCHRLILTPRPGVSSAYEKLIVWITLEKQLYRRIEYHDDGSPIKYLDFDDYREVGGVYYPYLMTMTSLTKKSISVVTTKIIEFDSSRVEEYFFTTSYLENIR